ncbi:MAG: class I SAM-dependent methyltransferase, partial [Caldimicrobium sp.]
TEIEEITIRGKTLKILRPAKLEEIFQGDPFLESDKFPLWFKIWEASIVLADYIASLGGSLKILELGAGLGVPSLVASAFGHKVLATDIEELPLEFIKKSAQINSLPIETQKLDIFEPNLNQKFDIIIGAEIVFKKKLYQPLIKLFKTYLKPSGEIVLSHSSERKKSLIPFLLLANNYFEIQTSFRRLRSNGESIEIILNRLLPKVES